MHSIKKTIVLSFISVAVCRAEVRIELVSTPPPPHQPGQNVTLDVYAHSEISQNVYFSLLRLDFSNSNTALALGPNFVFDLSASTDPQHFTISPELPIPWAFYRLDIGCTSCRLLFPAQGDLHVGSVPLQFPQNPGVYRVDVLNANASDYDDGAFFDDGGEYRLYSVDGAITGGSYDFYVGLEQGVPTISEWGCVILAAALACVGSLVVRQRRLQGRLVSVRNMLSSPVALCFQHTRLPPTRGLGGILGRIWGGAW